MSREGNLIIEFGSHECKAGVADYTELPVATFASSVKVGEKSVWPIQKGLIVDWDAFSLLCQSIIKDHLGIERFRPENYCLLAVPTEWNRFEYERIAHIFFEIIEAPGICIIDQALLAVAACGLTNGLVIDVGYETTKVTAVYDFNLNHLSRQIIPIGAKQIDERIKQLLEQSRVDLAGVSVNDLVYALKSTRNIQVLNADGAEATTANAAGEAIKVGEQTVQVANNVFSECLDVLFKDNSLQQIVYQALMNFVEPEKRPALVENVVLTGGCSEMKGLKERLENAMKPYLAASETSHEYQPKDLKFAKIPEHMTNYKERLALANFLGATVTSKLVFMDSRSFFTKSDYRKSGPAGIHNKI